MRLAAGYIAQAYAEQVLAYENSHSSLLEEIFEWGCDSRCTAEEGSDEWRINEMFHADDDVVTLWEHIKEEHMRAVSWPARYLMAFANLRTSYSFARQMGSR